MKRHTRPRSYDAFGESKTLIEWAKDPRCPVTWSGLVDRVLSSGMTVEQAFAQPVPGSQKPLYEAFGTRKTLREWSQDPRCPVEVQCLTRRVTFRKMTVEQAFAVGPMQPKRGRPPEKQRGSPPTILTLTAWGETKTLEEWAKDSRANASSLAIRNRIAKGYPPEDAINLQRSRKRPREDLSRFSAVTAWGKTKSTEEWAADPRANVLEVTIRARLDRGWPPELAISARWLRDLTPDQQHKIREARNRTPSPAPTKTRKPPAK